MKYLGFGLIGFSLLFAALERLPFTDTIFLA